MLIKALGIIDIISGFFLVFIGMGFGISSDFLWIFGIGLMIKSSLGLLKDVGSWIDFLSGGIFLLCISFNLPFFILMIFSILLIQKGIFSFL